MSSSHGRAPSAIPARLRTAALSLLLLGALALVALAPLWTQDPRPAPAAGALTPEDEQLVRAGEATWAAFRAETMIRPDESQDDYRARVGLQTGCDVTLGRIQRFPNRAGAYKPVRLPPDACVDGTAIIEYGPGGPPHPEKSNKVTIVRRGDQTTGVTSTGRVTNPDARFAFLREALK